MERFSLELVQPRLDMIHCGEKILCGTMRGYDLIVRSVEQTKGQKLVLWIIKDVIQLLVQPKGGGKADQMLSIVNQLRKGINGNHGRARTENGIQIGITSQRNGGELFGITSRCLQVWVMQQRLVYFQVCCRQVLILNRVTNISLAIDSPIREVA